MVLHPELKAHLLAMGPLRLPRKSLLYDFRLFLDYSSMLFAREFVFDSEKQWQHISA